jgi:hypothetical protein
MSRVTATADGVNRLFALNFDYLSPNHVFVTVGGALVTEWRWVAANLIELGDTPPAGTQVVIQRVTPTAPITNFVEGGLNRPANAAALARQAAFLSAEAGNPPLISAGGGGGFTGNFAGSAAVNYLTSVTETAATAITASAGQTGGFFRCTASTGVTVTLPSNLPVGTTLTFGQAGTGQITFVAGAGATLVNRSGHTRTAGQHALVSVLVTANAGGDAATWTLSGDTAA